MRDRLFEALKKSTADYAEIRFEENDGNNISFRGRELDATRSAKVSGGIVRALTKGGWGQAIFDSPEDMGRQVLEACRCAELVGRERTQLADVAPVDKEVPARMKRDFRGVALDDKIALISGYNDILLHDRSVESTRVAFADSFRKVWFGSTRGNYFMEERPRVVLYLVAIARNGSLVQEAFEGVSSAVDYDVVLNREVLAETVAKRSVGLLAAPQCEGGPHTVVLDPGLAGVFIHEAFGHLSEADFLYENEKMRDLMHLGREIGVPELNVVDDGSAGTLLGTQAFDDEGTPTQKTYLIRNGVLTGHLHSLETAAKMGAKPTGNARAIARGHPPIVRMTNTYIEPGKASFEDLVKGVDKGIYACDMLGGQTMMEMFTFTAAYGFRIENGKIGPMVRDVVLTGNVFETLKAIDGIASDFKFLEKGGGCGKGGQSPLPVTEGAPHVRIRNVVVGGR